MLQFVERMELSRLIKVLSCSKHESSSYFKLFGESGSGKTELVKKAVEKTVKSDMLLIYIDITEDEFQSTSFFPTLLETVYMPFSYHYNTIINIPESLCLSKYISKIFKSHRSFSNFFNTMTISASAIPNVGGPISLIMDKWIQEKTASIDNMLFLYFKYIIKKTRINLIIDNYQFLPGSIKRVLETSINQFNFGFTFLLLNVQRRNLIINTLFAQPFTMISLF